MYNITNQFKIIIIYDVISEINKDKLIEFIINLQQQDGSKPLSYVSKNISRIYTLIFNIRFFGRELG